MAGDLYVRVIVEKHKLYTRKGADLFIERKITLLEALTGISFNLTKLDGDIINIQTAPGEVIGHNIIKCVKGMGMPFFKDSFSYGNLYVQFQVEFPKSSTLSQN